ncbi:MAG: hypothetical protein HC769_05135 [Cyanobacteria bacterium CRU_2_1]|nr:hypothetical protein [Cyanobacteria bacterium RU_5_0]NJR58285.1 hypothetical protein [Cyanobacteria bacterium CRU_2_1]
MQILNKIAQTDYRILTGRENERPHAHLYNFTSCPSTKVEQLMKR